MGMRGTWETTGGGGGGGSGAGTALLYVLAAGVAIAVLGPIVRAAVSLLETLVVVAGVILGAALIAAVVLVVWRLHRRTMTGQRQPVMSATVLSRGDRAADISGRTMSAVSADTDRLAIAPASRPEIHIHLSGTDAEADAAAIRALLERAN